MENVGPETQEDPMYDPALLAALDWSGVTHMKGGVTCQAPGPGLRVRPLCKADYDRGFLQLLAQLTKVGDISREKFEERFEAMRACRGHYYVTVIEDVDQGRVVGAATLACEMKFIRGCAKRGRLEDVVVSDQYRGKQLGKLIVTTINLLACHVGCYKLGLDCKDSMKPFYSSLGYTSEDGNDNTMIIRFPPPATPSSSNGSPPSPPSAIPSHL
ncbi:probable glucosamine 6-phosphate N-acetyltransferase isoform X2 [Eriocheir sinensis]|uniref:probable glucosamine 6-phosphate N-acetyltransferase isoform X2 n=1 Tax=Eriocheir sinensis TaxID=95602 RepID=UPI0021C994B7|nr:probable glucosamine 6-phosphate N-acetyltransferase isoform X2 [Eriocheir sinensis]